MSAAEHIRLPVATLVALAVFALPAPAIADTPMTRMYEGAFGAFQEPGSIAVDESTGDVYVLDAKAATVSRYDYELQPKSFSALGTNVIDGRAEASCEPLCDGAPTGGFDFKGGSRDQVAVDNSGNPLTDGDIYVTDTHHHVVDAFAPSGAFLGWLTATGESGPLFSEPCGVAVGPSGTVYVSDWTGSGKLDAFAPSGGSPADSDFTTQFPVLGCQLAVGAATTGGALFLNSGSGTVKKLSATTGTVSYAFASNLNGIAVDATTGHVFAARAGDVQEYDASGGSGASLVSSFGGALLQAGRGVAADPGRSRVYVSDAASGQVDVYGPPVPAIPPSVATGPVDPLSGGRETLTGYIDAEGTATKYYFEYGGADCAGGQCASIPATQDGALGKGAGPVRVSQGVSGLQPDETYHYRLVAVNAAGTARSPDRTFTTLSVSPPEPCPNAAVRLAQGLPQSFPDCRAYERVSTIPEAERNAVDVLTNSQRVRVSADGGAFEFSTSGGGEDAKSVAFTTEYTSVRDPGAGWITHGISPPQSAIRTSALVFDPEASYVGEFAPDLSRAFFLSVSSVNDEGPNVQEVRNLYRREDVLEPGPGRYRLLSDSIGPQTPRLNGEAGEDTTPPTIVGASTDLSRVYFESTRSLTADAKSLGAEPRLYEWADGEVRLAGVLPAAEGGGPTLAVGGQGGKTYSQGAVSSDGSRILFTAPPFGKARHSGRLFLRDDHGTAGGADDTTASVSASEKTNGSGPEGRDSAGTQMATFWAASDTLSQVFFTSTEALTDDAPENELSAPKLYRYDLDAPAGEHLTLLSVDHSPADGTAGEAEGVIGASRDGSYVYFIGSNQLVDGLPIGHRPRIFVWHDGRIAQVATLTEDAEAERILATSGWASEAKQARVSADGRSLVFVAGAGPEMPGTDAEGTCEGAESSPCREVYLFSIADDGEERLRCASCRPDGQPNASNANFNIRDTAGLQKSLVYGGYYLNHAVSSNGGFVFFTSEEQLSPYDENEATDVYELDRSTGTVQLLSGGKPGFSSYFLDASPDGRDVFFATRGALLESDGNQSIDVYDARINGGFAEVPPTSATPCASADACRPLGSGDAQAGSSLTGPPLTLGRSGDSRRRAKRTKHRRVRHRHHRHPGRHRGRRPRSRHRVENVVRHRSGGHGRG